MTTQPRGAGILGGRRWLRGLAVAGAACAIVPTPAVAQPAKVNPAPQKPGTPPASDYDKRVVAYVYNNVPVTREELGEFLIARGGFDKPNARGGSDKPLELLVNRKLIEIEAYRRGVYATADEIGVSIAEAVRGAGAVREDDFFQFVRQRFDKSRYEWEQDVIRPRILLGKMCRDRVKVTEDELRRLHENRYGEKRRAQIIAYPKGQPMPDAQAREAARTNPDEFVKLASTQPNPELAQTQGNTQPVGRYGEYADPRVDQVLFGLQVGHVSEWIETKDAWLCIKLLEVLPPDPNRPLEKVRGELEKELIDKKLGVEIPKFIEELKKAANPVLTQHVPVPPAPAVPPGEQPPPPPVRVPEADPKVLARVYGTLPVTREDLGEFLIARGGYEKLELLVNRKIIDIEAGRRGVTVTPQEVEAALRADVAGLPPRNDGQPITLDEFVKHILPVKGTTLFEYTEDVIKPRLLLRKMCQDRVKVTDEDLRQAFENKYGEKRGAKIIIWEKTQLRLAQKQWDECRRGETEGERDANFDRVARGQVDGALASRCGEVLPVGRYVDADNPVIEHLLFGSKPGDRGLQPGEVSHLIETPAGIMCVKCTKIYPPAANVTLEVARPGLEKETYEKKLAKEVPAFFAELRKAASPNLLLKGPPTDRENAEGVRHLIQQLEGLKK
jgi:hypothetical protein